MLLLAPPLDNDFAVMVPKKQLTSQSKSVITFLPHGAGTLENLNSIFNWNTKYYFINDFYVPTHISFESCDVFNPIKFIVKFNAKFKRVRDFNSKSTIQSSRYKNQWQNINFPLQNIAGL